MQPLRHWHKALGRGEITVQAADGPGRIHSQLVSPAAQAAIGAALEDERLARVATYPSVDHAFSRAGGHSHDARVVTIANGRAAARLAKMLG